MIIENWGAVAAFLALFGGLISAWIHLNIQVSNTRARIVNLERQNDQFKIDLEKKVDTREVDQILKKIDAIDTKMDNITSLILKQK